MSNSQQIAEAKSYFMSEYKNDWEWAYGSYLEKKASQKKNIFKSIFSIFFQSSKG